MNDTKIAAPETSHPLVGTHRVTFTEGDGKKYRLTSVGPRYLVAVADTPGRIGRIILPDTAKKKSTTGFIVGLGDGVRTIVQQINPDNGMIEEKIVYEAPRLPLGQLVIFGEYAGIGVTLGTDEKEFRLIEYGSVSGYLTEVEGEEVGEGDD